MRFRRCLLRKSQHIPWKICQLIPYTRVLQKLTSQLRPLHHLNPVRPKLALIGSHGNYPVVLLLGQVLQPFQVVEYTVAQAVVHVFRYQRSCQVPSTHTSQGSPQRTLVKRRFYIVLRIQRYYFFYTNLIKVLELHNFITTNFYVNNNFRSY